MHYVSYGTPSGEYRSVCRAAIVTHVYEDPDPSDSTTTQLDETRRIGEVGLCVLNPEGMFFNQKCRHSEGQRPGGTWHWPERV